MFLGCLSYPPFGGQKGAEFLKSISIEQRFEGVGFFRYRSYAALVLVLFFIPGFKRNISRSDVGCVYLTGAFVPKWQKGLDGIFSGELDICLSHSP